ncbi:MAG: DUF4263 domain-containing protein [Candidatus Staskawiczbacteria bacterium]|nr:DUF4263 domain-containing protein [Candidatus Staskawiczbacteria bacterium]
MINFFKKDDLLILSYESFSNEWVFRALKDKEEVTIKKTFTFRVKDLFDQKLDKITKLDYDKSVEFIFGKLENNYFKIEKNKLNINKNLFIYKNISITSKFFIANRDISIFKKIDRLIDEDIYIGGEKSNTIPWGEYNKLLKNFPNSYELTRYADARLSSILKNYFDRTIDSEKNYHSYMNKKITVEGENLYKKFQESELIKYKLIYKKLEEMLVDEDKYNEKQWQNEMLQIILLLYPKYIHVFENTPVKDDYSRKIRKLDYLLVDAGGNIDIVEIKKPFDNCIITKSQYRDNYIPMRELSGTVMQIEKYIFYLNKWGKKGEKFLTKKYKNELPKNFNIKIINPCGLIIMGRDCGLNLSQRQDFEVVRRKYKNIIDILTYDDLIRRLDFVIRQLECIK